ncbi:MAG: hypothetical protein MI862_26090 [Desulfobacterales bacterium]|nr:hypothetical protein [Desulfobacterales bacterium]
MEKISAKELKESFESHYNHTYKSDQEFITAAEHEYSREEKENGDVIFSGGDEDFIVTDWAEFCQNA